MKDWAVKLQRTFYYLSFFVIGCFCGGLIFHQFNLPTLAVLNNWDVLKTGGAPQIFSGEDHPYGRAFQGVLPWEHDRRFHEACAQNRVSVRMAAYQTTLPDPLPGEEYNVALAARLIAGTSLAPDQVFMMNTMVGPYSEGRGFQKGPAYMGSQVFEVVGGGVCKIASTLYNVVTLANLEVIERYPHSMQVPYVPPGQDATVSAAGNKDFKFRNSSSHPILIWADTAGNTLYMAIYGCAKPPEVTWRHQILNRQPFWTVIRNNRELKPGQEKVVIPGADGLTVRSWLLIKEHNGEATVRRDLGIDHYKPLVQVVERGQPRAPQ